MEIWCQTWFKWKVKFNISIYVRNSSHTWCTCMMWSSIQEILVHILYDIFGKHISQNVFLYEIYFSVVNVFKQFYFTFIDTNLHFMLFNLRVSMISFYFHKRLWHLKTHMCSKNKLKWGVYLNVFYTKKSSSDAFISCTVKYRIW